MIARQELFTDAWTNSSYRSETTCAPITIFETVSVTVTVTEFDTPGTVTILQQDPSSVAASMASIDTVQVRQSSELAPTGNHPDTTNPVFTHSVRVSGFEATELPNDGTSVFYRSKSDVQTGPSHITTASIIAGVTTVTVEQHPHPTTVHKGFFNESASETVLTTITLSPVPLNTTSSTDEKTHLGYNATAHPPFTSPPTGWNLTSTASTTLDPAETQETLTYSENISIVTVTTASVQVVTITEPSVATITANSLASGGYGFETEYGYDIPAPTSENGGIVKRQTCVWISATISGHVAHWCNNWDGQSVLTYTSWETTGTWSRWHVLAVLTTTISHSTPTA